VGLVGVKPILSQGLAKGRLTQLGFNGFPKPKDWRDWFGTKKAYFLTFFGILLLVVHLNLPFSSVKPAFG